MVVNLDISNFDTSRGKISGSVFEDCNSLEFLNLKSTIINSQMPSKISSLSSPNLTICSK